MNSDHFYIHENNDMIEWLKDKSPEQRHFAAMNLNWDFATPTLHWLVEQKDCDIATVVELFWKTIDMELVGYPTREVVLAEAPWAEWHYDFVENIIKKTQEKFYQRQLISYNLSQWRANEIERYREDEERFSSGGLPWILPEQFKIEFHGIDIDANESNSPYLTAEFKALQEKLGVPY